MSNIVYPNIGVVGDNLEAKKQTLVDSKPQVIINNHIHPSHPTKGTKAQPSTVEIETQGKRLKITAWILIAIGSICALNCIWGGFHARTLTEKILSGEFHKGSWWNHHQASKFELPETIDRDEFALYDTIKTLCFFGIVLSMLIIRTGKKALVAT